MKIDIVTGSRAEYGIMRNLISRINVDPYFELRLIVTGMHLEEKYGMTVMDIMDDGYEIYTKIDSNMNYSSDYGILHSIESTFKGFKELYTKDSPDVVLILGDRYEIFAVAQVCSFLRIPIIHLHGGEKTEGNYDEFIRHAITKMSKLHFVAAEEYKNRVIQLGENPSSVFNVGALGVENVKNSTFKSVNEINTDLKVNLEEKKYVVIAFHPETLTNDEVGNKELLKFCESIIGKYKIIFIGTNSDTGSDEFTLRTKEFVSKHNEDSWLLTSVPSIYYYSLIKNSKLFVGNSSSGLIEVPSLGVCTINIGNRQQGRLRGNSVFDVKNDFVEINEAFIKVLNYTTEDINNPYEKENTCQKIVEFIKENENKLKSVKKEFYDLNCIN